MDGLKNLSFFSFVTGCVVESDSQEFSVLAIFENEATRAIDLINGNAFYDQSAFVDQILTNYRWYNYRLDRTSMYLR